MIGFDITNVLRNILLDDKSIQQLVERKIYPLVAPKDTTGDFVVYKRDKYSRDSTKMGISQEASDVIYSVVSSNYNNSVAIAGAIKEALHGKFPSHHFEAYFEDSEEDFVDGKFIQLLLFKIKNI